jgi:hypothetical protein
MTINIMNQYIDIVKKQITTYMQAVFNNKFKKDYNDKFIEKYINTRYFDFYNSDENGNIRKKIIEQLKNVQDELNINHIEDRELIEQMCIFFYYVLYFDHVVYYKDLREKINKTAKLRYKILGKQSEEYSEEIYLKMINFEEQKKQLIENFSTDEFILKLSNYKDNTRVYKVNLLYNIKFPREYSEYAIRKAFITDSVGEDRLFVEYYLVVIQILKDILKQNFQRQYIIEFSNTLLTKPQKLKSLLNIINNPGIQDKISLKIKYEKFCNKKEEIYKLMREGYRIALIIDNSFKVDYVNIEMLKMFKYVIIDRQLDNYEKIMEYRSLLDNVLEV